MPKRVIFKFLRNNSHLRFFFVFSLVSIHTRVGLTHLAFSRRLKHSYIVVFKQKWYLMIFNEIFSIKDLFSVVFRHNVIYL